MLHGGVARDAWGGYCSEGIQTFWIIMDETSYSQSWYLSPSWLAIHKNRISTLTFHLDRRLAFSLKDIHINCTGPSFMAHYEWSLSLAAGSYTALLQTAKCGMSFTSGSRLGRVGGGLTALIMNFLLDETSSFSLLSFNTSRQHRDMFGGYVNAGLHL